MRLMIPISLATTAVVTATTTTSSSSIAGITILPVPSVNCTLDALTAIQRFCGGKLESDDLMAPSNYAATGARSGDERVFIESFCDPPQWVPVADCYFQFLRMCLEGASLKGESTNQRYGRDDCQVFAFAPQQIST